MPKLDCLNAYQIDFFYIEKKNRKQKGVFIICLSVFINSLECRAVKVDIFIYSSSDNFKHYAEALMDIFTIPS